MNVKKHQTKTFGGMYVNADTEIPSHLRVGKRFKPDVRTSDWAMIIVFAILFVCTVGNHYLPYLDKLLGN